MVTLPVVLIVVRQFCFNMLKYMLSSFSHSLICYTQQRTFKSGLISVLHLSTVSGWFFLNMFFLNFFLISSLFLHGLIEMMIVVRHEIIKKHMTSDCFCLPLAAAYITCCNEYVCSVSTLWNFMTELFVFFCCDQFYFLRKPETVKISGFRTKSVMLCPLGFF